nr:KilA-N domain-containing protein [Moraxella sp. CTOTU48268]
MSSLTVLNHEIHQVDNLYCLNDLHKASGGLEKHRPTFFLRNQETKDLVAEIIDEKLSSANLQSEKSDVQIRTSVENSVLRVVKGNFGKAKQGAFACKEIVYRYAMWISPKFALAVIRVFDAFANGKLQPTQPQIDTLSSVADRKPLVEAVNRLVDETGAIYSNVWKMVHQQFNIESVDQLTKEQVKQAIAYIHSLFIVAVKASKTQKAVNIEHIQAMYLLGENKTNENYELLNKLQHIINDLDYFAGLVRKNTATQLSAFKSIEHQFTGFIA